MSTLRRQFWNATWGLTKVFYRASVTWVHAVPIRRQSRRRQNELQVPKRILLLNGAHIGDVIIATSVIPILRKAYPAAELGFVTGSWSQMVVRDHPDITHLHLVDHWVHNRSKNTRLAKFLQYVRTRRNALREIRALGYDVAISVYTQYSDLLDLAFSANIPMRIGFKRSLFYGLATHVVDQEEPPHSPSSKDQLIYRIKARVLRWLMLSQTGDPLRHQSERLAELLRPLQIDPKLFKLRHSNLPPSNSNSLQEVCAVLGKSSLDEASYRIIHMGTGDTRREFSTSFWRELAEKLSVHHTLLFTGRGEHEADLIAKVTRGLPRCINACGRLSWGGFVAAVRHAEVLYGVESMAGHVAAAVGTKCVVMYGGAAGVARWRPDGENSMVFTNHVPCAPCHKPNGCPAMTCMKGFTPDEIVRLGY